MTSLQRTMVAIGALDLAYVAWVALGVFSGAGLAGLWQGTVAFGLPLPSLQIAGILIAYLALLACGLGLVLRRVELAWLNYVLFPFRLLFALPTLFPLFGLLSASGIALHPGVAFAMLFTTELLRVILVRRWQRQAPAAVEAPGAAA